MKRLLIILLALLLAIFMPIVYAEAPTVIASGTCGENLSWSLDSASPACGALDRIIRLCSEVDKRASPEIFYLRDFTHNSGLDCFIDYLSVNNLEYK